MMTNRPFKIGDKIRFRTWEMDGDNTYLSEWKYGVVRNHDQWGNVWVVQESGAAEYVDPRYCEQVAGQ